MAHVAVEAEDVTLDDPVLIEGLPGIGLVGKIAVDHLVEQLDMTYYAGIECEGIPKVRVYQGGSRTIRPPVRLFADAERDVVALQSHVPVSRTAASDFARCVTGFVEDVDGTALYLSGLPTANRDGEDDPDLYGVATGGTGSLLDEHEIAEPDDGGLIGGPTGALLDSAADADLPAAGLVVEASQQFPDPGAARALIETAIGPIAGVSVDTTELVEDAEQIRAQRQQLAQQMQQAEEAESSQAQPLGMFQ
ncbi:MAG: proteasome assembly chaperone family protein [Halobacteriaceae archaeon]